MGLGKYQYTVEQAAQYLGTDEEHIRQLIGDKELLLNATSMIGNLFEGYFSEPRDAYINPTKWREFQSKCGRAFNTQFKNCFIHIDELKKIKEKLNEKKFVNMFLSKHSLSKGLTSFKLNDETIPINGKLKSYLELFISFLKKEKIEFQAKEVREYGNQDLKEVNISSCYSKVTYLNEFVEKIEDRHGSWKIRL